MPSVFMSHSHTDKEIARRLAADIRSRGHVVWIDEAEIRIGDSLIEKIREGIDQVDFVAAILSKASVESPWVQRELDIASNREIDERRVIVLPLLVEEVELPGFLKGKFYGDFRNDGTYDIEFEKLIDALGPAEQRPSVTSDEVESLKAELELARAAAARHQTDAERARQTSYRQKSDELKDAIADANKKYPLHAPINTAYAFELAGMPITLDYVLWCIAKSNFRHSPHQIEALLEIENKWEEVRAMLEAYKDVLDSEKLVLA